ncbi:short-chain dehydrogenase [Pseudoalteromonas luteoviolacea]|uniref:Putative oxidoreductase protein n=1 Tax=Pseudoalteromonas luteoviolacea TaxID=43657 RepID=A0A023Q009_9GAMM|nr:SDR family oxidoreductase [Pseudoalteromonas luteoviolacea]AHX39833.1 putative oxidoreductase protein [Pseudoalteromonas luteoviolacea]KID56117.1 short-chain dehydrogenase [Pseudoalteromonas luteoviolacea]
MPSVLITGANRGIGLALVRLYLEHGWHVHATVRNMSSCSELRHSDTLGYPGNLDIYSLDVTDYVQLNNLAGTLQHQAIDIVINNAGLYGPKGYGFGHCDVEAWREVMEVNAIAPAKLAESFYPHLMLGQKKVFAALSSRVGSHTENTKGGGYIYRSSKAALNSVIKSLSNDLLPQGIKTVALHPGWVKTEMGGPNALISPEESAQGLKRVIDQLQEAQSGCFLSFDGSEIPW